MIDTSDRKRGININFDLELSSFYKISVKFGVRIIFSFHIFSSYTEEDFWLFRAARLLLLE